jgi:hypothetical protein
MILKAPNDLRQGWPSLSLYASKRKEPMATENEGKHYPQRVGKGLLLATTPFSCVVDFELLNIMM